MNNILITGANGYIGARLSKYFSENGYSVTALCYPAAPVDESWTRLIKNVIIGDIRNAEVLNKILSYNIDTVIHLVSLDHNQCTTYSFDDVLSVNVNPIGNILEKFSKKGLKKFIYFSTFQVYGKIENNMVSEEHNTLPLNLYGLTHLLSEQICSYYHSTTEVECITIRLSNSYGSPVFIDNNCWWLVINELCRNAWLNGKIQLKSDGSPLRDFIHSSDVCAAIKILVDRNERVPENTYNLSSGRTLSILELAFKVKEVYSSRFNMPIHVYLPDNTITVSSSSKCYTRFQIDNSKLKKYGFSPSFSLEDGINDLFNYLEINNAK